jgi:signal transduction histidine kinase
VRTLNDNRRVKNQRASDPVSPAPDRAGQRRAFLSTLPAQRSDRRLALGVVLVSAVIFLAMVPFAKQPLAEIKAFIPIYESVLPINDLITAILLFGQFSYLRSRALFVLACGYLFTALVAVAHMLSFPDLFSPTGLLGAKPQTTAWLYFFWHSGFPLIVIAYAVLKDGSGDEAAKNGRRSSTGAAILYGIAAAVAAVCMLTLLATVGHDALPAVILNNRYTGAMIFVISSVWVLSLLALVALWWRRPHSVLDLWLMVVMCAWLFDIALSAVLNGGRFDVGWYGGRVYGLLAASFVLVVLLLENGALYAKLADAYAKHTKRLEILHEIDLAVAAREAPEVIAGGVVQPLREVLDVPRTIVNIFNLEKGEAEWLAAAGRRQTHVGPGVRYSIRLMGDVEALRRGEPQRIDTRSLPAGPETDALLASGIEHYMVVPMIAGGELIGAISFGDKLPEFPTEQMNIASEVATQLAIAITQARLYERVRRHAEELELRVRERTAELQTANRELESFSYSVSHDLRAPLRAMNGFSQMLEEDYGEKLDAEGHRLLGVIRANSERMGTLIDDLLAFSRLGRQPLATQQVQLEDLVQQTLGDLRPGLDGRKVEFAVGELGAVQADPALLRQALANLLGNAVKFTQTKDPAVVEVGRGQEPAGNGTAVYYVRDNGAGFDMKYYDKLFGVFQRLHSAREFEGTGVGLAIVKRIIERHGGRVWAESIIGAGTTFYFTLGPGASG